MAQPADAEQMPPPPPPPPSQDAPPTRPPPLSQDTPPPHPPPPHQGGKSISDRVRERVRELIYPLAIAVTSFVVSFAVGVMAANVAAAGIASRLLLLYEVFKNYGLLAMGATVANAVVTVIDKRLDQVAAKYRPATFDKVVEVLLVGGREGVPAYQQYPFLGMILVPVMTAILFVFMFAWRIVRNLEAFKALVNAAARVRSG
ncbi:hypothetical protein SEUCBS139899_004773 [Sporothrix eucalyptigena]